MTEKFTFFWSGPFSQWHKAPFEIDHMIFNCAEQWMMWQKACLFGDRETAKQILMVKNPREQKNLGRMVKDFNPDVWAAACKEIVKRGNLAKYSQNPMLLDLLSKTKGTTLVEASPYDRIWGIGLAEDDPKAQKRETWKGKNLLGEILTEVRKELCGE